MAGKTLVFVFALACFATLAAAERDMPVLRCQWQDPNTRERLDLPFSDNAMVVVSPGDSLRVSVEGPAGANLTLLKDGEPYRTGAELAFTAPANSGAYYLAFELTAPDVVRGLELCVFVPYRAAAKRADRGLDVYVDGVNVGNYRAVRHSGNAKVRGNPDSYQPPAWWIRITPENESFRLAYRFKAGDLVAPDEDTGIRHSDLAPVNYVMWRAVEALRRAVEAKGIPGDSLKTISAFRTPAHNRAIGSNAFGRHIFGDAFDFYIDLEGDAKSSDLNGDGKIDRRDAYRVVSMIENLWAGGIVPIGGVGIYHTIGGDHGLTMHLDMRGHRATWGYLYGAGGRRSEFSWASRRFPHLDREDEEAAAARAAKAGKPYRRPNREQLPAE